MTEQEQERVIGELIGWFKDQEIRSVDGVIILMKLLTRMHVTAMRRVLAAQREAARIDHFIKQ